MDGLKKQLILQLLLLSKLFTTVRFLFFFFSLQDLLDVFLDGSPKTQVLKQSYVKAFSLQYTHILGQEWLASTRFLLAEPSMVHHVFLCKTQVELLQLLFRIRI